jgi:hypothetical protein
VGGRDARPPFNAYSDPVAPSRRFGNGTDAPSAECLHVLRRALQQRRVEDARQDRVDADAVARKIARDRQRHADDAALRCRIGRLADLAVFGRDRGGVDDRAAFAVFASGSSVSMPAADLAMQRKVPTRLIWMMRSKASSGKCLISPSALSRLAVLTALPVPAQLIRMRSWPMAARALAKPASTLFGR